MKTDPKEDYERGWVPFLGVSVSLKTRPLIPRTETEYWVEQALQEIEEGATGNALDLFSGSGCIGLSVMAHRPLLSMTFGDSEERHFESIKESINVRGEKRGPPPRFITTDVWSNITGQFSYLFANPPYLSSRRGTVDASVVDYEPKEALFAKDDGFFFIEKFIRGLSARLEAGGVSWIEHEPFHKERIEALAREEGFSVEVRKDQYGTYRVSRLTHLK